AAEAAHARGAADCPFPRDLRRAVDVALLAGRGSRERRAVSLAYPSQARELPRFVGRAGGAAGIVLVLVVWELLARTVLASTRLDLPPSDAVWGPPGGGARPPLLRAARRDDAARGGTRVPLGQPDRDPHRDRLRRRAPARARADAPRDRGLLPAAARNRPDS